MVRNRDASGGCFVLKVREMAKRWRTDLLHQIPMQHSIKGCVQSLCDWPHLILCCSHAYQERTTEWLYIKVVTWLFLINRKEFPNYLFYDWNFTTEIEVRKLISIASEIAQGGQLPCHTPRHQARGIHLPVPLIQIPLSSCIVTSFICRVSEQEFGISSVH